MSDQKEFNRLKAVYAQLTEDIEASTKMLREKFDKVHIMGFLEKESRIKTMSEDAKNPNAWMFTIEEENLNNDKLKDFLHDYSQKLIGERMIVHAALRKLANEYNLDFEGGKR